MEMHVMMDRKRYPAQQDLKENKTQELMIHSASSCGQNATNFFSDVDL